MAHTVQWWLDRLENVRPVADGYMATCPGHPDGTASLHVSPKDLNAVAVVHDFGGCPYENILRAVEARGPLTDATEHIGGPDPVEFIPESIGGPTEPEDEEPEEPPKRPVVTIRSASEAADPAARWAEYTRIPWDEWHAWGCRVEGNGIAFTWPRSNVRKVRRADKKQYWRPEHSARPPLWPSLPDEPGKHIWITEGETDCGVLRHVGLPAFGVTKGSNTSSTHWGQLREQGVEEVSIVFDIDDPGRKGASNLASQIRVAGLSANVVDITPLLRPLDGEKDIWDVWARVCLHEDAAARFREQLATASLQATAEISPPLVTVHDFLQRAVPTAGWLVHDVWPTSVVGMIVGSPKIGKSWLALDLGLSVATSTPFLGRFEVDLGGPVIYLTKEDPEYVLQDRLRKIMIAKGSGGRVTPSNDGHGVRVSFPQPTVPFCIWEDRSFLFDDERAVEHMLTWLDRLRDDLKGLALVIFDPVMRTLATTDEYKMSAVGATVFKVAEEIRTRFDASVALVHHMTKDQATGKGYYGSVGFGAFSENTLYLKSKQMTLGEWAEIEIEAKSVPSRVFSYRFVDLDESYSVEAKPGGAAEADPKALVLAAIRSNPGIARSELVNLLGISQTKLYKIVEKLIESGIVREEEGERPAGLTRGPRPKLLYLVEDEKQ